MKLYRQLHLMLEVSNPNRHRRLPRRVPHVTINQVTGNRANDSDNSAEEHEGSGCYTDDTSADPQAVNNQCHRTTHTKSHLPPPHQLFFFFEKIVKTIVWSGKTKTIKKKQKKKKKTSLNYCLCLIFFCILTKQSSTTLIPHTNSFYYTNHLW